MISGINAATPAPNAIPNVDEGNNKVQENQEEVSNVQTEETSNVNSTEKAEHNERNSNAQAEDHTESVQGGHEADTKAPADQNESRGTALDVFG